MQKILSALLILLFTCRPAFSAEDEKNPPCDRLFRSIREKIIFFVAAGTISTFMVGLYHGYFYYMASVQEKKNARVDTLVKADIRLAPVRDTLELDEKLKDSPDLVRIMAQMHLGAYAQYIKYVLKQARNPTDPPEVRRRKRLDFMKTLAPGLYRLIQDIKPDPAQIDALLDIEDLELAQLELSVMLAFNDETSLNKIRENPNSKILLEKLIHDPRISDQYSQLKKGGINAESFLREIQKAIRSDTIRRMSDLFPQNDINPNVL